MEYSEVPAILKELTGLKLKPFVKESYGKPMVCIEKNDNYLNENALKAISLIAKQKNYKIVDFDNYTALF